MYYLQRNMIIVSVVLPILAAIATAARFQARRIKRLPLKADDWFILLAMVITVADCVGCIYSTLYAGVGQLTINLDASTQISLFKFLYADIILCHFTYGIIKISVVLFYKRIFDVLWFRKLANVVLLIIGSWTMAAVLSAMFSAWPISNFWNLHGKTEFDFGNWTIVMAVLDLVLDVLTLLLPLLVIKNLHLSTKKKISVLAIFWLGSFCVAASGVRLWYSIRVKEIQNSPGILFQRPEYAANIQNQNTLWARIEACFSIVAACLPTIAPLATLSPIRSFIDSWGSRFSKTRWSKTSGSGPWDGSRKSETDVSGKTSHGVKTSVTALADRDIEMGKLPNGAFREKGIVIERSFISEPSRTNHGFRGIPPACITECL